MSGRNRNQRRKPHSHPKPAREGVEVGLPADNPVLMIFKKLSEQLNDRHDRHERLVKLSRDTTIESKRIIFLLHSSMGKGDHGKTLKEARERLTKLIQGPIKSTGLELNNRSDYLHYRATSPGFQEFVEAYTFYSILNEKNIATHQTIQDELNYDIKGKDMKLITTLTQGDYMLGLADLTGEIMRRNIHCITSGDVGECDFILEVIQTLCRGFASLMWAPKELHRKLVTTRLNARKVESALFAVELRGTEAVQAPHFLQIPLIHDDLNYITEDYTNEQFDEYY